MGVINQVSNSLKSYFNALTQFGYKKQADVDKLLAYIFIEELLTGEMRFFITEDDYRLIEKALNCLYGSSCLIPYPKYINEDSLFGHTLILNPRSTEDNNLRYTEYSALRL